MPTNSIQLRKIKLTERVNNEAETPERRLRAAKTLLLFSKFAARPHRLARKIANLFISDGLVSNEVREQAAKLLELTARNAVNDSEPEDEDGVEIPTQYQIKRPKTKKASKEFQEAILNGSDLYLFHYWEPEVGDGWPASDEDFKNAKTKARDILWPTVDPNRPRYVMEGGSFTTQRTEYGEQVLNEFYALAEKILAAPTEYNEPEPATPLASPTDYGVEISLTRDQIIPRPDLSVPPELRPGEINARATCSICRAGGFALPHDCMQYQQDLS